MAFQMQATQTLDTGRASKSSLGVRAIANILYKKVLTQPCCWVAFFPAIRQHLFESHNLLLEITVSALLLIVFIEGEALYKKLRGRTSDHSRATHYMIAIPFMALIFALSHLLAPH
ncbi:MAG: hypothetical protein CMH25_03955 [Micavibrio sp.]|nr:hypothetical protein [Micavibrio sp.]|tara:strand:+ start:772478 stop:772825 length:348 start_codon:yes stop_codon:yes gene_type:complete